jgi:hypothetical protein
MGQSEKKNDEWQRHRFTHDVCVELYDSEFSSYLYYWVPESYQKLFWESDHQLHTFSLLF